VNARLADALLSDTVIVTPFWVPPYAELGVPDSLPVDVLNVAQAGLPEMLNVSGSLFASLAVGVKLYAAPTATDVAGVPLITGGVFVVPVDDVTVSVNDASDAEELPSDTLILTPDVVPVALGVPLSFPVPVLKLAQEGLFEMENVSVLPSGSFAVGVNE
jgi:hypothetical protein